MISYFKLMHRTSQLQRAIFLATELFDGDINQALVWIGTPHPHFFNFSPAQYVLGGNGKSLINWLEERLG
jgi:hypothetical protein